eukprot:GHVU01160042.1.p3 GENE.GHVU01160042.1~~GHVU01160042.1.p3  ORF type:complete len:123 (+),score=11.39 GHVU01160042.1:471-839(+)
MQGVESAQQQHKWNMTSSRTREPQHYYNMKQVKNESESDEGEKKNRKRTTKRKVSKCRRHGAGINKRCSSGVDVAAAQARCCRGSATDWIMSWSWGAGSWGDNRPGQPVPCVRACARARGGA